MRKLSRQAGIFLFIVMLVIFFAMGYLLMPRQSATKKVKTTYHYELLQENIKVASHYYDGITSATSHVAYQKVQLTLYKGTNVSGYTLSHNQAFDKYLQLLGPSGGQSIAGKTVSHVGYVLLLTGDVVRITNNTTKKKTIEVVNARVTCTKINFVLSSDSKKVTIKSNKTNRAKTVSFDDFKKALNDTDTYQTMISW